MKNLLRHSQAVFSLALLVSFLPRIQGLVWAENPETPKQYLVHCVLKRQLPIGGAKDKKLKTDAEPIIVVNENSDSRIAVGGEVKVGKEFVFFGTLVDFHLQAAFERQVQLDGKIEVSHILNRDEGRVVKESTEIYFSQTMEINKQVRIPISKTELVERWLEIRIEAITARSVKAPSAPKTGEPKTKKS